MPIDRRSRLGPDSQIRKDLDAPNNAGPYIGIVKEISDPQRMGTVLVYIASIAGPEQDDVNNYISCRYASPFWGQTPVRYNNQGEEFSDTQKSYGMWFPTVDIDTRVLVTFADGNINSAFWWAVIPDQQVNNMVPGGGFTDVGNTTGGDKFEGATLLPTGEINKANAGNPSFADTDKAVNKNYATSLVISGLLADNIRGTTTSSARRESPSQAFGIATPGPLAEEGQSKDIGGASNPHGDGQNSRLGGHQFIMDDGEVMPGGVGEGDNPANEMIKLRTRRGAQLLLHDTENIVYISNATGSAWMEFSSDGKIDIFASDSISVRSAVDMNFFADRDMNLEAGRNVNIKATGIVSGSDNITGRVRIESAVQRVDPFLVDQEDNSSSGNIEILSFNNTKINADRGEIHIRTNQVGTGVAREDGNKELIMPKGIKMTATGDIDILAGNEANSISSGLSNINIEALDDLNIISRGDTQIFSADKINIETQSKFELYADDDINIEVKKTDNKTISLLAHQVGIRADQDISMFGGRDVNVVAATDYNAFAGTNYNVDVGGIIDLQGGANTNSSVLTVAGSAVASSAFLDGSTDVVFPKNSVYKDEADGDSTGFLLVEAATPADPIDGLTTHILPDALPNDPETGNAIDYPYQKADGAVQARVDSGGNLIIVSVSKRVPTHEPYQQHESTDKTRFARETTDREGVESSVGGEVAPYAGGGADPIPAVGADGNPVDSGTGNKKPPLGKPSGVTDAQKKSGGKPSYQNFVKGGGGFVKTSTGLLKVGGYKGPKPGER